jgi:oligoribonuclease NrnB/cAMP/cGMP phosphodiesterase (DHH superfamily)
MIGQTNGQILCLDHHKTALKELEGIPEENKVFDMNHSGAYITWTYFFGFVDIPRFIMYIEDNDIWLKEMPYTKEFTSYMSTLPMEFKNYEKLLDSKYLDNIVIPTGKGMVIQNDSYCDILKEKCVPRFMLVNESYYFVATLSSDILKSEMGHLELTYLPYVNFSAIFSNNYFSSKTSFSLRSDDNRTDVSEIAKKFLGGGHRNASGIGVNYITDTIPGTVIDSYRLYYVLDTLYDITAMISDKCINFAVINLSICQKHIAKYLMQYRTSNLKEANAILAITDSHFEQKHYSGSIVWNSTKTGIKVYMIICDNDVFHIIIKYLATKNAIVEKHNGTREIIFTVSDIRCVDQLFV